MHIDELQSYCESKKAVTSSMPFDQDVLVFKVMNKMFCLTSLKSWEEGTPRINVKCDPETALEQREQFSESVTGGYHMDKKTWNTILINQEIPDDNIVQWIDHSYDLIVAKLSKKDREHLKNL
jgi:predicted DNA-binding protein (MmcQ/YjbR family)